LVSKVFAFTSSYIADTAQLQTVKCASRCV
jgi:hypothetical protein